MWLLTWKKYTSSKFATILSASGAFTRYAGVSLLFAKEIIIGLVCFAIGIALHLCADAIAKRKSKRDNQPCKTGKKYVSREQQRIKKLSSGKKIHWSGWLAIGVFGIGIIGVIASIIFAPKNPPIDISGKNIVEGFVEYQIYDAFKTDKVEYPVGYRSVKSNKNDSNKEFIVVAMKVKNLNSTNENLDSLMKTVLKVDGVEYSGSTHVLTEGSGGIYFSYTIDYMNTANVYFAFDVKKGSSTDDMKLIVTVDKKSSEGKISLSDYERDKLIINQTMTDNESMEVTVKNIYYTDEIHHDNSDGAAPFYKADEGCTFLVVKLRVRNLKDTELKACHIANVKGIFDGDSEYYASSCIEEDYGTKLLNPESADIDPSVATDMYCFMEIPEILQNKKTDIQLYTLGDTYYYKVK